MPPYHGAQPLPGVWLLKRYSGEDISDSQNGPIQTYAKWADAGFQKRTGLAAVNRRLIQARWWASDDILLYCIWRYRTAG